MKRYLFLWKHYISIALIRNIEFRSQFFTEAFSGIIWIAFIYLGAGLVFLHTQEIAGWSRTEIFLLISIWGISQEAFNTFFWSGLGRLSQMITQGTFDMTLVQPVNQIFQLAVSRFELSHLLQVCVQSTLFIIFLIQSEVSITFWNTLVFILLFLCSFGVRFAIHLLLQSLAFWFINIDNVRYVYFAIVEMGRFPTTVFQKYAAIVYTGIPIAYIGTVQTQFLIGKGNVELFVWTILATGISLGVAFGVYFIGSRKYSSASS